MAFLIGIFLAVGVGMFGSYAGFDRERSFYPVIMIVIAAYYVLYALMTGDTGVLLLEMPGFVLFSALAVLGYRHSLWWAVAALALHGVFDVARVGMLHNPGVPAWWPPFCVSYDVIAAAYLSAMLKARRIATRPVW
jgi:hypothetical protein